MKIKLIILCTVLMVGLTGCGELASLLKETVEENESVQLSDVSTYIYKTGLKFVCVDIQSIKISSAEYLLFLTFVDLETGVMYFSTLDQDEHECKTFETLLNADGTPCVYEELEELRKLHGWENE